MNRIGRFYKIDQLLHARGVVSLDTFLTELEVSRATFKRDIEYLRDRLYAPIVWDRSAGGYRQDGGHAIGPVYELPGLWFSASELYALLTGIKLVAVSAIALRLTASAQVSKTADQPLWMPTGSKSEPATRY